jgi:hypothetical protein
MSVLEVKEGLVYQAADATHVYKINVSANTTSPAAPAVPRVIDMWQGRWGTNVTALVMPTGTHTASGTLLTLRALTALVEGHNYVVHYTYTDGGSNTYAEHFRVECPNLRG